MPDTVRHLVLFKLTLLTITLALAINESSDKTKLKDFRLVINNDKDQGNYFKMAMDYKPDGIDYSTIVKQRAVPKMRQFNTRISDTISESNVVNNNNNDNNDKNIKYSQSVVDKWLRNVRNKTDVARKIDDENYDDIKLTPTQVMGTEFKMFNVLNYRKKDPKQTNVELSNELDAHKRSSGIKNLFKVAQSDLNNYNTANHVGFSILNRFNNKYNNKYDECNNELTNYHEYDEIDNDQPHTHDIGLKMELEDAEHKTMSYGVDKMLNYYNIDDNVRYGEIRHDDNNDDTVHNNNVASNNIYSNKITYHGWDFANVPQPNLFNGDESDYKRPLSNLLNRSSAINVNDHFDVYTTTELNLDLGISTTFHLPYKSQTESPKNNYSVLYMPWLFQTKKKSSLSSPFIYNSNKYKKMSSDEITVTESTKFMKQDTKYAHVPLNDQYETHKNNLSHEANYKLSKVEQDESEGKKYFIRKWRKIDQDKRSKMLKIRKRFNPMDEIKLKTTRRLMKNGFGASLPSNSLIEAGKQSVIDHVGKEKYRKLNNDINNNYNLHHFNDNDINNDNNDDHYKYFTSVLQNNLNGLNNINDYDMPNNKMSNNIMDNSRIKRISSNMNDNHNYKNENDDRGGINDYTNIDDDGDMNVLKRKILRDINQKLGIRESIIEKKKQFSPTITQNANLNLTRKIAQNKTVLGVHQTPNKMNMANNTYQQYDKRNIMGSIPIEFNNVRQKTTLNYGNDKNGNSLKDRKDDKDADKYQRSHTSKNERTECVQLNPSKNYPDKEKSIRKKSFEYFPETDGDNQLKNNNNKPILIPSCEGNTIKPMNDIQLNYNLQKIDKLIQDLVDQKHIVQNEGDFIKSQTGPLKDVYFRYKDDHAEKRDHDMSYYNFIGTHGLRKRRTLNSSTDMIRTAYITPNIKNNNNKLLNENSNRDGINMKLHEIVNGKRRKRSGRMLEFDNHKLYDHYSLNSDAASLNTQDLFMNPIYNRMNDNDMIYHSSPFNSVQCHDMYNHNNNPHNINYNGNDYIKNFNYPYPHQCENNHQQQVIQDSPNYIRESRAENNIDGYPFNLNTIPDQKYKLNNFNELDDLRERPNYYNYFSLLGTNVQSNSRLNSGNTNHLGSHIVQRTVNNKPHSNILKNNYKLDNSPYNWQDNYENAYQERAVDKILGPLQHGLTEKANSKTKGRPRSELSKTGSWLTQKQHKNGFLSNFEKNLSKETTTKNVGGYLKISPRKNHSSKHSSNDAYRAYSYSNDRGHHITAVLKGSGSGLHALSPTITTGRKAVASNLLSPESRKTSKLSHHVPTTEPNALKGDVQTICMTITYSTSSMEGSTPVVTPPNVVIGNGDEASAPTCETTTPTCVTKVDEGTVETTENTESAECNDVQSMTTEMVEETEMTEETENSSETTCVTKITEPIEQSEPPEYPEQSTEQTETNESNEQSDQYEICGETESTEMTETTEIETTECTEELTVTSEEIPNEHDTTTESTVIEISSTYQTCDETTQQSTECPPSAAPEDQVKLNISINANVMGSPKNKNFVGNGTINVMPSLLEDRNRRHIFNAPIDVFKKRRLCKNNQYCTNSDDDVPAIDVDELASGEVTKQVLKSVVSKIKYDPKLEALWKNIKRQLKWPAETTIPSFYALDMKVKNESSPIRII